MEKNKEGIEIKSDAAAKPKDYAETKSIRSSFHDRIQAQVEKLNQIPTTSDLAKWIFQSMEEYLDNSTDDDLSPEQIEEHLRELVLQGLVKLGIPISQFDRLKIINIKNQASLSFKNDNLKTRNADDGYKYEVIFDGKTPIGMIDTDEYNLGANCNLNREKLEKALNRFLEASI